MKILNIGGGGVFGIIPATLLEKHDVSKVDLFAGTSIGSIQAIMHASGYTPKEILSFFQSSKLYKIFNRNIFRIFNPFNSKWSDKGLNSVLQEILPGDLSDCDKYVLCTAYYYPTKLTKVWHNMTDNTDLYTKLWKIARSSSAAPTFFPPYKGYIDGGWWANDPSLVATAAAISSCKVSLKDIEICTLTCGAEEMEFTKPSAMKKWHLLNWVKPIIDGVTSSNEQATSYVTGLLPYKKKVYINPIVRKDGMKIDNTDDMLEAKFNLNRLPNLEQIHDKLSDFLNG